MSIGVLPGTTGSKRSRASDGWHRRFYWRIRHRLGADWSKMTDRQISAELRRMSYRRAL